MIIVSQNKKGILNFDNIQLCRINQNGIIYADLNEYDSFELGEYKTGKRAKEVLQEIITRYKNWENMKVGQPSGLCLPVYEMPED